MINKELGVDIPTRINQTETLEELIELMGWCRDAADGYDHILALNRAFVFGQQSSEVAAAIETLSNVTKEDLVRELGELNSYVFDLLNRHHLWSEEGTYTFPDGNTFQKSVD
jgi:hypothetical protein